MVSYFSGGGLAEAGIRDLFRVIGAVEFDPAIASWYHRVNPEVDLRVEDVCTVDPSAWVGVDLFHASPSCRNASNANQEAGETPEDIAAGKAVERGIRIMRPKLFTLENVRGYRHFSAFSGIVSCLEAEGYRVDYRVYNAASWGVPQTRERLYLRAWKLNKPLPWIAPTHQERQKLIDAPGADMFADEPLKPWVGWYEALTHPRYGRDLIPTLPPSALAKWQLERLKNNPEIAQHLLVGVQGEGGDLTREAECPAEIVAAGHSASKYRALLVEGDAAGDRCPTTRYGDEPSFVIKAAEGGRVHRAVSGGIVVKMTPEALARFQMGIYAQGYPLPEKLKLACQIIGNGCCSEFMRVVVLSMMEGLQWEKK